MWFINWFSSWWNWWAYFWQFMQLKHQLNKPQCCCLYWIYVNPYNFCWPLSTNLPTQRTLATRLGSGVPDSRESPELSTIGFAPNPFFSGLGFLQNIFLLLLWQNVKKNYKLLFSNIFKLISSMQHQGDEIAEKNL